MDTERDNSGSVADSSSSSSSSQSISSTPVPPTSPAPIPTNSTEGSFPAPVRPALFSIYSPTHIYFLPERAIYDESDIEKFKESPTSKEILDFTRICADSVVGKSVSAFRSSVQLQVSTSHADSGGSVGDSDNNNNNNNSSSSKGIGINPILLKWESFMAQLENDLIKECPPINQPMRYGNKAFRTWHSRLCQETPIFLRSMLPPVAPSTSEEDKGREEAETRCRDNLITELSPYISTAFGNEIRIDYGTGHELGFVLFFLCLFKLRLIAREDFSAVVLVGFAGYLRTMRKLQLTYMLEPAGSHGVWGLDDHHCLSFIFGASQLINHPYIQPSSIHNRDLLTSHSSDYFYLESIRFIRQIKSGAPFAESSPMLNDISNLTDWSKITVGLLKVFQNEVVWKRVVVQHTLFGSILTKTWEISKPEVRNNVQAMGSSGLMSNMPGAAINMNTNMTGHPGFHNNNSSRPPHPGLMGIRPTASGYSPSIRTTYHLQNAASTSGLASNSSNSNSSGTGISNNSSFDTTPSATTIPSTIHGGIPDINSVFIVATGRPTSGISDAELLRQANLEKIRKANEAWSKM